LPNVDLVERLARDQQRHRSARREVLSEDRDNPGRYFQVVFFDSYVSAMKNSELPVTQEFAEKMSALADGPPTFYNLNVVEHRTFDER
jgi:hypothetical protein